MPANLKNSAVATDWKRCFHSNAKECSNYCTIVLISHASKVMLKILQARLQQFMNCELPGIQAAFRKGRGTRDQIANICWIIEKAREFQKIIYFYFMWLVGCGGLVVKLCPTLATPWSVACQLPLYLRFSRQEYWSGFPFPSPSALLTMPKPLTVWITINCGKFGNRWEYQTTLPAS